MTMRHGYVYGKMARGFRWHSLLGALCVAAAVAGCEGGGAGGAPIDELDGLAPPAAVGGKADSVRRMPGIACGERLSQSISMRRSAFARFSGRAGDVIGGRLALDDGGARLRPVGGVFGADGALLARFGTCDDETRDACLPSFRLPADGVYVIGASTFPRPVRAGLGIELSCEGTGGGGGEPLPEDGDAKTGSAGLKGGEDPCNATIVTSDGAITARDLCDMIEGSGKNVYVFHSQCYGGDVAMCCGTREGGNAGCHYSGGAPGELQRYGEYDQAVADALRPGATTGRIHEAGEAGVPEDSSTPTSHCPGRGARIAEGDSVITFAGDPAQADHDMAQQIQNQNGADNTTVLSGDGSAEGVDGAATADNLRDAIEDAESDNVFIWLSDHGNRGGKSVEEKLPARSRSDLEVPFPEEILEHMHHDPGQDAYLFLDSPDPLPAELPLSVNGETYVVPGEVAARLTFGERSFHRLVLPIPEEQVRPINRVTLENPSDRALAVTVMLDSGPIAKLPALEERVPSDGREREERRP